MSGSELLAAVVGGLVGGSISAFLTWLWTHRQWERTTHAFKTTARYLTRLILDPESVGDLHEDEKGWLRGFEHILTPENLTERQAIKESVVAVKESDGEKDTIRGRDTD